MYNGKLSRRWNKLIRDKFVMPKLSKRLQQRDWTLICNNCTGGFVMHDLGQKFRTPTVNLYFPESDYFDFVENLAFYMSKEIEENVDTDECPCGIIRGGGYTMM